MKSECQSSRIHYFNFAQEVPALIGFKSRHLNNKAAQGIIQNGTEDYRFNAIKFCHKVFALTHCALTIESDILSWIDADSHTFKAPSPAFLKSLMPDDIYTCYLGRRNMHSECGFMGFDLRHPANREFMEFWLSIFDEDRVFELPQWHDSYVYDVTRQLFEDKEKFTSLNLRADIEDDHHPFLNSVLGDYFDHLIGPRRKIAGTSFAADIRTPNKESRWEFVPFLPEDLIEKLKPKK